MSGTVRLKQERKKYRYMLEDEAGNVVMKGAFIGEKEKAESYIKLITDSESLEDYTALMKGPDGKWIFKGFFFSVGSGSSDTNVSDAVPLGFSPDKYDTEEEAEKARQVAIEAAKGSTYVDES
ncbi:hypothetical protein GMI69_08895 [Eggerthellaceae bacterium zg-887]|uniref:hypothetical protein n=1 Tax=Xiamenia xianingshaonis TaxID=2682776 RepID=UPI00140BC594|nr:hypothetical protein [Xiamenia xianingshaonis]NHM16766.1 hypothetical protein [Xiamenia xianingshaonis]